MARLRFAGLTPGCLQLTIRGEPVDPRVSIAIGDVEVSRRRGNQFAGIVEGARRSWHQVTRVFASRVGMDSVPPKHLNRLAVQRVHDTHGVVSVSNVDGVVCDVDSVSEFEGTVPP